MGFQITHPPTLASASQHSSTHPRPLLLSRSTSHTQTPQKAMLLSPPPPSSCDGVATTLRPGGTIDLEDCLLPSTSVWTVRDDKPLPVVPLYYPLQKTHVVIEGVVPSLLASRVSECLRMLSVAATYDDEKVSAKAVASDLTKFYVRLYSKDEHNTELLMELQRVSGSSIKFHQCYRAIVKAAKGQDDTADVSSSQRDQPPYNSKRIRLNDHSSVTKQQQLNEDYENRVINALELASGLLGKDRVDANLLGIESLSMLTNPTTSGPSAALCAATHLLKRSGSSVTKMLLPTILSLVIHSRLTPEESKESETIFDVTHYEKMRNYALAVMANMTSLLPLSHLSPLYKNEVLLSVLVSNIKNCTIRPHDAYLSTLCLNKMIGASEDVKRSVLEMGLMQDAKMSFVVGQCGHERLERESERMVLALKEGS